MRILRSTHSVNPAAGGPIESIKQSSAVLTKLGHTVEIVSLDAPNESWVQECPVPVHALGPGRGSYGYAPGFTPWIAERRASYDVVIVQGVWQYSSFGVWRALRGTSTPYFVFTHGMLDPWFKRTYPLKHIKKLLYWPWGEYRVLRDAAAVLFTSEEERRLARQSFSRYRCREEVVNYGTAAPACDLAGAREHFFGRFPQLRGKRLLLFLGRIAEKKGCDLLIQGFAEARGADDSLHLVIAGPASNEAYLAELQTIARASLGADGAETALTFTGMLAGEAKWGAFSAAEAFVLPSHQENFGIAVVEAMACGTPVLISNQVNIWREITKDGAGFADDDSLAGTTRLLLKWLQTPDEERTRMRASAKQSFARRFEITQATESLLRVLTTAVKAE
jgi:glycosyltransferase involved in cell wall biosynthesis